MKEVPSPNKITPSIEEGAGKMTNANDIAIRVESLSKCYQIYGSPRDRLKQFVAPRLQRLAGLTPKQYYREFWALKDLSFEIKKGETVGIIGRNGSGKSTLLQIICGTLTPTGGSVQTNGRIAALLELGSGFNPEFTGHENVYMNAAVLGLSNEETDARYEDIVAFADIGNFIEQPVKTYSSGMMMRLAFAVSVCIDPDILVIDEALAVGDAAFQFKCMERMKRLTESGTTLLFVSHDMGMVKSFCSRVIYLASGREKMCGQPEVVTEQYFLDIRDEQHKHVIGGMPVFRKKSLVDNRLPAFGTEEGRIVSACFRPDGSAKTVVRAGDKVVISIETEYVPELPSAALSIIVMDRRMLDIGGKFFFLDPTAERDGKLFATVDVEFNAKFRPGSYLVSLRLESRVLADNFYLVDKQPAALSFEVISHEQEFLGMVNIGMRQLPVHQNERVNCGLGSTNVSIENGVDNRVPLALGTPEQVSEFGIKRFTLCCVVDENPRLHVELVLWVICVKRHLPLDRYRVIVYHVGNFPRDVANWLEAQGIEVRRIATAVVEGSPHCNKIAPLFDPHETDYIIVCDTDLYFVDNPAVFLVSDRFRAPPNNHCNPPSPVFKAILTKSGLGRGDRPGIALFKGQDGLRETNINNISGGFIAVPERRREIFSSLWRKWARWLVQNRALLGAWAVHVDQVAFALAMEELGEDVELLPPQTNAVLHILGEIRSVYAFHLSTGHIPDFPGRFNVDRTLNTDGLSEDIAVAGARLNVCIKEATEVISTLPSTKAHMETFLNPTWRR
jgi:ABC-type polysaccharide/polyol phosphate transport system ATPase subunit